MEKKIEEAQKKTVFRIKLGQILQLLFVICNIFKCELFFMCVLNIKY